MLPFRSILASAATFLLLAGAVLRASDPIPEPTEGRSAIVKQTHVTAELIAEPMTPGKPFDVVLHLHMDKDWHTYWINPGDAGLTTTVAWTMTGGLTPGPLQFPTPEIHAMGPLTTYGYGGDVYLLTTITPGSQLEGQLLIKARVDWLVCQEECIPGHADLSVPIDDSGKESSEMKAFLQAVSARMPVANMRWDVAADYGAAGGTMKAGNGLYIELKKKPDAPDTDPGKFQFFPEQPNVLSTKAGDGFPVGGTPQTSLSYFSYLQQNGEKPKQLSGVLVSDQPLIGDAKSVYIASFPTDIASVTKVSDALTSKSSPLTPAVSPKTLAAPAPFLVSILLFAFIGGLILNLMPCVLPVLSLKVFSLIKHAGNEQGGAWKQGVAFTAGVLVSFWVLAGLLIALESAGSHLGWGFQMQSPGFVLALIFLFFLLGLNLLGVFEFGASLVGLDVKATSNLGGLTSSFANGALATLAATPCTAPFMGSAVGFAAQQPAAISLLVFTFLALGMAAPYLALTTFPGALKLVPKPGAWMDTLKQFMGFLLLGTVIFLLYVFGALVGQDSVPMLLGVLLVAAIAAWIYGRGNSPLNSTGRRFLTAFVAGLVLAAAIVEGVRLAEATPAPQGAVTQGDWQPWSPDAVQAALAKGQPVFVDFTAAWCLSCKVNEQVALEIDSTKQLFTQKHVALFRGDWTHSDPKISDTLQHFNRNGVPLYLVYSPKDPDAPQVLPEVLTPRIVQGALQKLP